MYPGNFRLLVCAATSWLSTKQPNTNKMVTVTRTVPEKNIIRLIFLALLHIWKLDLAKHHYKDFKM